MKSRYQKIGVLVAIGVLSYSAASQACKVYVDALPIYRGYNLRSESANDKGERALPNVIAEFGYERTSQKPEADFSFEKESIRQYKSGWSEDRVFESSYLTLRNKRGDILDRHFDGRHRVGPNISEQGIDAVAYNKYMARVLRRFLSDYPCSK